MDSAYGNVQTRAQEGSRILQMEDFIGAVLRWGVLLSATVIGIGVVMAILRGASASDYPTTMSEVIMGVATLSPLSIIDLGLLLLIATPVIRVAMSAAVFLYEKDYHYVLITLFVLAVLLLSFVLGKVE